MGALWVHCGGTNTIHDGDGKLECRARPRARANAESVEDTIGGSGLAIGVLDRPGDAEIDMKDWGRRWAERAANGGAPRSRAWLARGHVPQAPRRQTAGLWTGLDRCVTGC